MVLYCFLLRKTCSIELRAHKKAVAALKNGRTFVFSWHGRILIFPPYADHYGLFTAVSSPHSDGNLIEQFLDHYGHSIIRGSNSKQAIQAMRAIKKELELNHNIFITPDGPKGPKFKINGSSYDLAVKYKSDIVSASFSCSKGWKLKTWDEFVIPALFSKIILEISEPFVGSKDEFEKYMNDQTTKLDSELNF